MPDLTTSERLGGRSFVALAGVLLAGTLFASGGSADSRLFWLGSAALALAGVACAASFVGLLPPPALGRAAAAFVALLAGFVAWSALSIVWSVEADRSWDYANRGIAYVAFTALGLLAGSLGRRARSAVAVGLTGLLACVLVWALAGKVAPSLGPDVTRNARLREPVGYWNTLAVIADMALVLGIWVATRPVRAPLRAGGVVVTYLAGVAVVLTLSRGGIATGFAAIAAWLLLAGPLLESLAALVVALVPATAVAAWATSRSALVDAGQPHAARAHDGRTFGLLLVAGALLAFGAALLALAAGTGRPLSDARRRLVGRAILGAAGTVALAALAVSVVHGGGPAHWFHARVREFANPVSTSVVDSPGRFAAGSSNHRWTWWGEAWHTFTDRPWKGSGAGSFEVAHRLFRKTYAPQTREPHELALQALSETGVVGFALLVSAFVAAALAAWATLRRETAAERAASAALAACAVAFTVHLLVDIGWDYAALSGPALFVVGALAAGGPRRARGRSAFGAVAAIGLAAAAISSLASPWLASRRVDAAYGALAAGRFARAASDARSARGLDPLSVDAVWTSAIVEEVRGRKRPALYLYAKAVDLQPLNPDTWYALGAYEVRVLHDCLFGYRDLNRSYTLDPYGPAGSPGSLLVKATASVNRHRRRC